MIIEPRDLVLPFGETPALRGADLSVQGEVLAVMGPSGSGKSPLLYYLAGILVPDSGEVSFDGQRLDAMREEQRSRLRRDRFGFVFQSGQLVSELTAEENVGGLARRAGLVRTARTRWLGTSPRWRDVPWTGTARRAGAPACVRGEPGELVHARRGRGAAHDHI